MSRLPAAGPRGSANRCRDSTPRRSILPAGRGWLAGQRHAWPTKPLASRAAPVAARPTTRSTCTRTTTLPGDTRTCWNVDSARSRSSGWSRTARPIPRETVAFAWVPITVACTTPTGRVPVATLAFGRTTAPKRGEGWGCRGFEVAQRAHHAASPTLAGPLARVACPGSPTGGPQANLPRATGCGYIGVQPTGATLDPTFIPSMVQSTFPPKSCVENSFHDAESMATLTFP